MPFRKPIPDISNEVKSLALTKLAKQASKRKVDIVYQVQKGFFKNTFSRNPYDTGLMYRKISAKIQAKVQSLIVSITFAVSYSKYVLFGYGTNAKYGERNPAKERSQNVVNTIISSIYN